MNKIINDGEVGFRFLSIVFLAILIGLPVQADIRSAEENPVWEPSSEIVLTNAAQLGDLFLQGYSFPSGTYVCQPVIFEPTTIMWADGMPAELAGVTNCATKLVHGVPAWPLWVTLYPQSNSLVVLQPWSEATFVEIALPSGFPSWEVYNRVLRDTCVLSGINFTNWETLVEEGCTQFETPQVAMHAWLIPLHQVEQYYAHYAAEQAEMEQIQAEATASKMLVLQEEGEGGMMLMAGDPCTITNEADPFSILGIVQDTNGWTTITFESCSDHAYLMSSTDVLDSNTTWTYRTAIVPGQDDTTSWTDTSTASTNIAARFYRVQRLSLGDSVGDGIADWWRQYYFGSATATNSDSCALCDPDNDGYDNLQEYNLATDPTNSVSYPPPATDEFVGPFDSWTNVTAFGAVGDGISNCTAAIQDALNHLGMLTNGPNASVLYFPHGTYLITNAVRLIGRKNVQIIGEDPGSTILKLGQNSPGFFLNAPITAVLQVDGVAYSTFERLTFDGGGNSNVVLVDQSKWYGESGEREVEPGIWAGNAQFDTGNRYVDCIFTNGGDSSVGIRSGHWQANPGGGSEGLMIRDQFIGLTYGFLTRAQNSLDWWAWNSVFRNNYIGLSNFYTNSSGNGNFSAFGCIFLTNTLADMSIINTEKFVARDCYSSGSGMFWLGQNQGAAAEIVLTGNRVVDCTSGVAVSNENYGPLTMIDNIFAISSNIPSVLAKQDPALDVLTLSNRYTTTATEWAVASSAYTNNGNTRFLQFDDVAVSRESLDLSMPSLPIPLTNYQRHVFEVVTNASAAQIQAVIDTAIASSLRRVVVHLPTGTYSLNSTLIITNDVDLQIVGDGPSTELAANQALGGEVIRVVCPSHLAIRDLSINGGFQGGDRADNGITITNADQVGARVFLEGCNLSICSNAMLWANGLSNLLIESHGANLEGGISTPATTGVGLRASGANTVALWSTSLANDYFCFYVSGNVELSRFAEGGSTICS